MSILHVPNDHDNPCIVCLILIMCAVKSIPCRYDLMANENQARDVATFISPSAEVAEMFFMTLMDTAEARSGASEELPFPDADIAAERIQQKLDVFEPTYCSSA